MTKRTDPPEMRESLRSWLTVLDDRVSEAEQDIAVAEHEREQARAEFAATVKRLRKLRGITLRECARRCGVSAGFMHDFEYGRRWSDRLVAELLKVLK